MSSTKTNLNRIIKVLQRTRRKLTSRQIADKMPYLLKRVSPAKVRSVIQDNNRGQIRVFEGTTRQYQFVRVGWKK